MLAGGVALNCVANGRLLREGPFDDIWIQPAAGDAGGALGAALFAWHQLLDKPRDADRHATARRAASSGRGSRRRRSATLLDGVGVPYHRAASERELLDAGRRSARRRKDRRLVPGPDGVRPARARRAQHPRRSAVAAACRRR